MNEPNACKCGADVDWLLVVGGREYLVCRECEREVFADARADGAAFKEQEARSEWARDMIEKMRAYMGIERNPETPFGGGRIVFRRCKPRATVNP